MTCTAVFLFCFNLPFLSVHIASTFICHHFPFDFTSFVHSAVVFGINLLLVNIYGNIDLKKFMQSYFRSTIMWRFQHLGESVFCGGSDAMNRVLRFVQLKLSSKT